MSDVFCFKDSPAFSIDNDDGDYGPSPFARYEKHSFDWPDLYTELCESLETCAMISPLAELRSMARQKRLRWGSRLLQLPLTYSTVLHVVKANQRQLNQNKFRDEFYLAFLRTASMRELSDTGPMMDFDDSSVQSISESSAVVAFDDEFAKEELVYSIGINHIQHRITICFRGTETKLDWAKDFQIYMKEIPNPLRDHPTQKPTIRMHNGFHDYLFEPNSRGMKGPKGENMSQYEEILRGHLLPLFKEYPQYKLYVTGHSLGAALATLFAFGCASAPKALIPKPVTCFSIGSPYVGDESFQAAHQLLEGQGYLRHLRVTNHKDMIPLHPKMSFTWRLFDRRAHVGAPFKHVGMNLRLKDEDIPFNIEYPKVTTSFMESFSTGNTCEENVCSTWGWKATDYINLPSHSLREYSKMAMVCQLWLNSMTLNDLYCRKHLVGDLVAHTLPQKDSVPHKEPKHIDRDFGSEPRLMVVVADGQ